MYERYLAARNLEGHTNREIARIIKRTEKIVSSYNIVITMKAVSIHWRLAHRKGVYLSDQQEQILAETIATSDR